MTNHNLVLLVKKYVQSHGTHVTGSQMDRLVKLRVGECTTLGFFTEFYLVTRLGENCYDTNGKTFGELTPTEQFLQDTEHV